MDNISVAQTSRAGASGFAAFAQALRQAKATDCSPLDNERGTALMFAEVCAERAQLAIDDAGYASMPDAFDDEERLHWQREANTWTIIHLLTAERLQNAQNPPAAEQGPKDFYQTPFAAVQELLDQDAGLNELKIIREWLQDILPARHAVEVRKGYWTFTKNRLRAEKRTGGAGAGTRGTLGAALSTMGARSKGKVVKSLDPDAPSRGEGALELEDASYEKALLRSLFEYARAGKLDLAFDLCRQADQSWRAASLRGAMLYHDPRIYPGIEGIDEPIGNRNRTLWKTVCRKLASNPSLDEYERALYGSLSGDLPSVLSVSQSWEEHLWAYVNAKFEAQVDAQLDARGGWWSQEADTQFGTDECGAVKVSDPSVIGKDVSSLDLVTIFSRLSNTERHGVHAQAGDPFHVVQRSIILNETQELLITFESRLVGLKQSSKPRDFARIVRFFAHLILYLRLLSRPLPDVVCNSILRFYVQVLEESGEDALVAMYASSLNAESATDSYAHFLKSMDVHAALEVRRTALLRAQEHDLDLAAVSRRTVKMIFDEVFPSMPSPFSAGISVTSFETSLDPNEERLVRAIDWLTFYEATYTDAIVQTNAVMRVFLASGKLHAARILLLNLPHEVISQVSSLDLPEDQSAEHVHWRAFFEALSSHVRYTEVWSKRPPESASRIDRHAWTKGLLNVIEQAYHSALEVFERGWIKFDLAEDDDLATERRSIELARIRQIYIPEMVFRIHFMFYDTREAIPSNLSRSVLLANLVADEKHKLYLEFVARDGNKLRDYLRFVRAASLASLEGATDPFRAATGGRS